MKKVYAIISLIISGSFCSLWAQNNLSIGEGISVTNPIVSKLPSLMVMDTLVPGSWGMPYQCDTAFKIYTLSAPNSGYAFGNNSIGETECAQKYYSTGTVSEVLVYYARKAGTTGITSARIYSIDPVTKKPLAAVATSNNTVTTGSISTSAFTSYTFSPAVTVASEFAIGPVFPTIMGDTVAVVSTKLGCSTPDSLSWANLPLYGGWRSVKGIFSSNLDLVILPVIDDGITGIGEYPYSDGLTLMGAYPNPASELTTINFNIHTSSTVSMEVFDINGRIIQQFSEMLNAGNHSIDLALKTLSSGTYYYTVKANAAQLTSKFFIAK